MTVSLMYIPGDFATSICSICHAMPAVRSAETATTPAFDNPRTKRWAITPIRQSTSAAVSQFSASGWKKPLKISSARPSVMALAPRHIADR